MAKICYFTFPTTYYAVRAEKVLSNETVFFKMVPVPRKISSSCGTSLRCACEDVNLIKEKLESEEVNFEAVHELEQDESVGLFSILPKKRRT